jgi:hypothetical protein
VYSISSTFNPCKFVKKSFFVDELVVFGGSNLLGGLDLYYDNLEIFNGYEWTVEKLEFAIGKHAMVQLPCPIKAS